MISNKGVKINTKLIVISVVVLTILTLGVSYSAFFDVKVQDTVQSFTAGTLNVTVSGNNKINSELQVTSNGSLPTTSSSSVPQNGYATLTLTNGAGNIPAAFLVTLTSNATDNALDLSKLIIGIYDDSNGSKAWVPFGSSSSTYNTSINKLSKSNNEYPILKGTIGSGATKTYRVYVWLSENAELTDIHKKVNLSLKVKSIPAQGQNDTLGNVTVSS